MNESCHVYRRLVEFDNVGLFLAKWVICRTHEGVRRHAYEWVMLLVQSTGGIRQRWAISRLTPSWRLTPWCVRHMTHSYESYVAHIKPSDVTHRVIWVICRTHEEVRRHAYEWVMSFVQSTGGIRQRNTYKWVIRCTHEGVTRHTYEWVMSCVQATGGIRQHWAISGGLGICRFMAGWYYSILRTPVVYIPSPWHTRYIYTLTYPQWWYRNALRHILIVPSTHSYVWHVTHVFVWLDGIIHIITRSYENHWGKASVLHSYPYSTLTHSYSMYRSTPRWVIPCHTHSTRSHIQQITSRS